MIRSLGNRIFQPCQALGAGGEARARPPRHHHAEVGARRVAQHAACPALRGEAAGERLHAGEALVERLDIVNFGIFLRKSANFRGLALFCIEADFCNQILIF